eukprot:TRINITY_DN80482_c0_g1_i1.p1 TRINITY_DN80482_c0_g1~~TRINITY_DN80482_c0_g1_i1.p1  ORF type:complete len:186 (-),score=57.44 TRINITY_DN80482_c0_g1_i1:165-722(-)
MDVQQLGLAYFVRLEHGKAQEVLEKVFYGFALDGTDKVSLDSLEISSSEEKEKMLDAFYAISELLMTSFRDDLSKEQVTTRLEEEGFSPSHLAFVEENYDKHKEIVREHLLRIQPAFRELESGAVRLDYVVRSDSEKKVSEPLFIVDINMVGEEHPVRFHCTPEQLQHLGQSVKDALRQMEKGSE